MQEGQRKKESIEGIEFHVCAGGVHHQGIFPLSTTFIFINLPPYTHTTPYIEFSTNRTIYAQGVQM